MLLCWAVLLSAHTIMNQFPAPRLRLEEGFWLPTIAQSLALEMEYVNGFLFGPPTVKRKVALSGLDTYKPALAHNQARPLLEAEQSITK